MSDMTDSSAIGWSESTSTTFIDLSEIFVPGRSEQLNALVELVPAGTDEYFTVVELASGEGLLAQAILEKFPHCHYIALDGSEIMRQHISQRLMHFSERLEIRPFGLADQEWRSTLPTALRCVLSSLCVHHLSDAEKQQLFSDMFPLLQPGGALLLADIIKPANRQIADLFAHQYDDIVRAQSLALRGDLSGFEQFQQHKWNYFEHDYGFSSDADSIDKPSLLDAQLRWFHEAGFNLIDCFWMRAGHAVYGGYK